MIDTQTPKQLSLVRTSYRRGHREHSGTGKPVWTAGAGQRAPESLPPSDVVPKLLPASGLQHVGFVEAGDREPFHGASQIFADLK